MNTVNKEKKIHFISIQGEETFSVPDGGVIQLIYEDGSYYVGICHYVDEKHFKLNGVMWNLHAFAEHMQQTGIIFRQC